MAKKKPEATMLGYNKAGLEQGGRILGPGLAGVLGFAMIIVGLISLIFSVVFGIIFGGLGVLLLIWSIKKTKKIQSEYS